MHIKLFGARFLEETWVSRSEICMTCTSRRSANLAHSGCVVGRSCIPFLNAISSNAFFTNIDIKPGFAPCPIIAVDVPAWVCACCFRFCLSE
ncbi:hypothetical protein D3C87_1490060 [compost metagenome]